MAERTYQPDEVARRLSDLPGWALHDGQIRRTYQTDGWRTTLMVVNAIGFLAEAVDHHPDLAVSWGKVTVGLNTHSAGGITDKDLELAHAIERTIRWRPEGSLKARGDGWIKD